MKKIYLLSLAAILSLAGCNSKTSENSEVQADTVATAPTEAVDTAANAGISENAADVVVELTEDKAPVAADGKAIVIDFSATWCGPCQKFKPVYHHVAGEYASKADFYTADLDNLKALASQFNVTSIPCVVIIKDGAEPVSHVGYMEEAEFKELLDKNI